MGAYGSHIEALTVIEALAQLGRIEKKIDTQGEQMATVQESLTALSSALGGIEEDVARVLDALANEDLSPEAQAAVDGLRGRMDNLNSAMDTAVPPPAPGPTP